MSPRLRQQHLLLPEPSFRTSSAWPPSFWLAFRLMAFVRVVGSLLSLMTDSDEVYNYWEPTHFLLYGKGFQTWEYAPQYAIRSYTYVGILARFAALTSWIVPLDKRLAFYTVRAILGIASALVECYLYRAVCAQISPRVGRYFFVFSLFSTGLWSSASSILPSSFAMLLTNTAFCYVLVPVNDSQRRTFKATLSFACAALLGWPFTVLLAVPFVLEEVFVRGTASTCSLPKRLGRLTVAGLQALLLHLPMVLIDSLCYGKMVFVPWNIIKYNALSSSAELYGTEPWHYYLFTGLLNFNLVFLLALASAPLLLLTLLFDRRLVGSPSPGHSSKVALLLLRLAPFYVWLVVLSLQPHKEERFLWPICSLTCLCGALGLYFLRNLLQQTYLVITGSAEKTARTAFVTLAIRCTIFLYVFLSLSRTSALYSYYKAPIDILTYLQQHELPRLGSVSFPELYPNTHSASSTIKQLDRYAKTLDFEPLRPLNLSLCYGAEWYRFPGHFFVPEPLTVQLVDFGFDGIMPKHFSSSSILEASRNAAPRFNDRNLKMPNQYVELDSCSYYAVLEFPLRQDDFPCPSCDTAHWDTITCQPFLDTARSSRLTRILRLPIQAWQQRNSYGRFCLLKSKKLYLQRLF